MSSSEADTTLRDVGTSDVDPLSRVLAEAFYDDPWARWIFPEQGRRRKGGLRRYFAAQLGATLAAGVTRCTLDGAAVAGWHSVPIPGGKVPRIKPVLQVIPALGLNMTRAILLNRAVHRGQPPGLYMYLSFLGTEPQHQRHGHGSALVRAAMLNASDAGLPLALETSTAENVDFYLRHGFRTVKEATCSRHGPAIWFMLRSPTEGSQH